MVFTFDITLGGERILAKLDTNSKNYDLEYRQYLLLQMLAKTINSRRHGTDKWLMNNQTAYDFGIELWMSLCSLACFRCEMDVFEPVMQGLIMKRLGDYGEASRRGTGKKSSAMASGSENFCQFDDFTDDAWDKPGAEFTRWGDVLYDESVHAPDNVASIKNDAAIAMQYLSKLDERTQMCFIWHAEGMKNTDIAQLLGVDESYVRKLNKSTAALLKAELAKA